MIYLLNGIILALASWQIGKRQPDQAWFYAGLALKIIAGVTLGFIFQTYSGGGDTFKYFHAASALADLPFREWWQALGATEIGHFSNQPRAIFFTKIVSTFILTTKGDYWIISSYLSFLSYLAFWFFYLQIRSTVPNLKWPVIIAFLLVPSSVFWSSGILKGTLTNASVVFLSTLCLKLFYHKNIRWTELLAVATTFLLLLYIKYYLFILVTPLVLYVIMDSYAMKIGVSKGIRAISFLVIISLAVSLAPHINPNLSIVTLPSAIHQNQQVFQNAQNIDVLIQPTWQSLLKTIPFSCVVGLFGPTILETKILIGYIPRIENLIFLVLTIWSLVLLIKFKLYQTSTLTVTTLLFILSLAAFLPLTAPNYGSLIRYKAAITPFFAMLVCTLPIWQIQKRLR